MSKKTSSVHYNEYLGLDKMEAGSRPDSNAELDSWEHSFTPAINYYFKNRHFMFNITV